MAQHRYTPRKLLSWLDGDLEPKTVDAAWASDQTAVPSYFIRERNNRSEPWPRKIPQDWHLLPGWKSARSRSPKPCGVKTCSLLLNNRYSMDHPLGTDRPREQLEGSRAAQRLRRDADRCRACRQMAGRN